MTRHTILMAAAVSLASLLHAAEPAASPLLLNCDFEANDSHSAWKEMSSRERAPSLVALDTENPHSGEAALKFATTSDGPSSRFIFTGINVPADHADRVRVRLYARTAGIEAGEAEINLLERDQSNVLGWAGGKEKLIRIEPSDDWKEYSAEVPLNPEMRVLTLMIRIQKPAEGKTVWVDDLSVETVDSAAP